MTKVIKNKVKLDLTKCLVCDFDAGFSYYLIGKDYYKVNNFKDNKILEWNIGNMKLENCNNCGAIKRKM